MNDSIKNKILFFLQIHKDWQFGGNIEDHIRMTEGHKASNASRRCRELEDDGRIESRYVHVPGVANKVVQYRLNLNPQVKVKLLPMTDKVREWNKQFYPVPVKQEIKQETLNI